MDYWDVSFVLKVAFRKHYANDLSIYILYLKLRPRNPRIDSEILIKKKKKLGPCMATSTHFIKSQYFIHFLQIEDRLDGALA